MAIIDSSEETTMADSEGTDSDKPPHVNGILNQFNAFRIKPAMTHPTIPLPPPEASAYDKQPGHTRGDLKKLSLSSPVIDDRSAPCTAVSSDYDSGESPISSLPSSRAPSRPGSRAPSMSSGTSGGKLATSTLHANGMNGKTVTPQSGPTSPASANSVTPTQARPGKPPSVHSDTGGNKFTLKDLLASGPKITRKASQRSTGSRSSRVSDSDAGSTDGGGKARSRSDSAVSLTQKYGVCQKVAIGKGATSVVRLAHKWDRSEEKLYAVKVSLRFLFSKFYLPLMLITMSRNSGNVARTRRRRSMSRSLLQNSASPLRSTTRTSSRLSTLCRTSLSTGVRLWNFALAEICMPRSRKGE
jgi:protein-serine/threonine kinase